MKILSRFITLSIFGALLFAPSTFIFAYGNEPASTNSLRDTNTTQKFNLGGSGLPGSSAGSVSALQDIHDAEESRIINAQTPMTFSGVIRNVIGLINQIIPVLFALALVFFMWSGVQYVRQSGEGGSEARGNLLWGVIALFVIFSVWGLVNILCITLLGGSCSG
ncbi:MAG: hypothetical protein V4436_03195 [Patescibacteria group bacterium]